jgi:HD-GYP domain-containing protein (c-di-GMP phosphodiesterase class II)
LKIVQIYASRSDWLLSSWEQAHNLEGPVVAQEMLAGLVRQTMSLDLTALLEAPEPEHRTRRTPSEPGSVVGTVDKAALLQVIEEIEAHSSEAVRCADPLSVAHSENVAQWTTAIARWMEPRCDREAVSLIQLQQALGMPLVEVWLGLLLADQGQYLLEQRGDFYEPLGIWLIKVEI